MVQSKIKKTERICTYQHFKEREYYKDREIRRQKEREIGRQHKSKQKIVKKRDTYSETRKIYDSSGEEGLRLREKKDENWERRGQRQKQKRKIKIGKEEDKGRNRKER